MLFFKTDLILRVCKGFLKVVEKATSHFTAIVTKETMTGGTEKMCS